MGDLKLFAYDENLEGLLQTVKNFSNDIGMKFGLAKCWKATFKKGRLIQSTLIKNNTMIEELKQGEVYKYHGVKEYNMPPWMKRLGQNVTRE